MEKNKLNILITGGLGHIGSKLIHSLSPDEFSKVFIIDNLLTQRYSSLFNLPSGTDYSFIDNDILDVDMLQLTKNIDIVIHLAAITDAPSSFEKHEEVELVNFQGTKRIAEACIENKIKLFFPSTTSIYGTQSDTVDEDCPIEELKPQSPYASYKLKSEEMLKSMKEEHGLKYVTCRFGTIFGKSIGMRFHTAVNKFCWQAVMGKPLTVWKTAMNQKRPYLGVNDAVRSIKFIIMKNLFNGEIYNIVSSNNSVDEIVQLIKSKINHVEIEMVDSQIMNQLSYHVLSDKIKKEGMIFNDNLESGIYETIDLLNNSNCYQNKK